MSILVTALAAIFSASIGLQAWTLNAVVELKTEVAALKMLVNASHSLTKTEPQMKNE